LFLSIIPVLKNLMLDLNRVFERMPPAKLRARSSRFTPRPGVLCCARFHDGSFYRGYVLGVREAKGILPEEVGATDSTQEVNQIKSNQIKSTLLLCNNSIGSWTRSYFEIHFCG
jgi:hypothetical protein